MKREKVPMKASKKLTILAITILLVAALISALWWVLVYVPYRGYVEGYQMEQNRSIHTSYIKENEEFRLQVIFPSFLKEATFLKVQHGDNVSYIDGDKENEYAVEFYVWPSWWAKTEYGLVLEGKQYIVNVKKEADGSYTVTHDYTDPKDLEVFAAHAEEIQAVVKTADEEWEWERTKAIREGFEVLFSKKS